jgi:PAS domain S-box-containing protein
LIASDGRTTKFDIDEKTSTDSASADVNASSILSEAGYSQTFIDTANAPIFGIDENVLVNEWNNKAVEITGYTRDEVMGQNLVERFITEEYRVSVIGVFDRALNGQEAANFEFPLFTKDMRRVEVLLNATTRRDVDGRNIGIISVGQDITDRKEEEVQMTRVAQELQTFIDTVNAPIFGIDENWLVNEWNNKVVEITVYSKTRGTTTRFENVATISSAATLNKSAVSSPSNASVISNSGAPPSTS